MNTILCYSGGLDSTVLLYHLKYKLGANVRCFSVDYGQKHGKELRAGREITRRISVQHEIADLSNLGYLFAGSSQTSPEIPVPEGHYAEESMKQTVVPNRNMVLLALAGAWAVATKSDSIAYAAHGGDHAIYPDCRPEFTSVMMQALSLCDWHKVALYRPFLLPKTLSKADIVKLGHDLHVPFRDTWSCYKGEERHCGKCGTCNERIEAFTLAGVKDLTEYQ